MFFKVNFRAYRLFIFLMFGTISNPLYALSFDVDRAYDECGGWACIKDVDSADLDGNGSDDLISGRDVFIFVRLNTGGDAFGARVAYSAASTSVTAKDVNGDGFPDLIGVAGSTLSVLINNKDGTFSPRVDYPVGAQANDVVVADVNKDGWPDLSTTNFTDGTVSVLFNNQDGTFASKIDYVVGTGPISITAADFDGDTFLDLAVSNFTSITVSILINNGNGSFAAKVDYNAYTSSKYFPRKIRAGKLNQDNFPDLVVDTGLASVFVNNGDGTFAAKVDYAGSASGDIGVGDLNGDNLDDLVATSPVTGAVSIYINTGDALFADVQHYRSQGRGLSLGDYNNDGALDLGVLNYGTISVFLNKGNGTFPSRKDIGPADIGKGVSAVNVAVADFDADGFADIVTANMRDDTISIFMNKGNGTYAPRLELPVGTTPYNLALGDISGDGLPDIAVANNVSNTVSVFRSLGGGAFSARTDYATGKNPTAIALGDIDKDNDLDLGVVNFTDNTVSIYRNVNGTFGSRLDFGTGGTRPRSIAIADTNLDGFSDLIIGNEENLSVKTNNGTGTFPSSVVYSTTTVAIDVSVADLDGDNWPEIAIAATNLSVNTVSILPNLGTGMFGTRVDYVSGYAPNSIETADITRDGWKDLIVNNTGMLSIYTNNGDGTYANKIDYGIAFEGGSVDTGDINGDGWEDVVIGNGGGKFAVSLLVNTSGDIIPTAYAFTDQTGASLNTLIESDAVSITGIDTSSPVGITGGEHSISTDGTTWSAWSNSGAFVSLNDRVKVRLLSPSTILTTANAMLSIGGLLDTFTVATRNNASPTISGSPTTTFNEDTAYSFTPTANDLDGDTLTFSITNKPAWAAFSTSTGQLSGTPGNSDVGLYNSVSISVSDGIVSASLPSFNITVNNVNDAPLADPQSVSVTEDSTLAITLTGSDIDVGDSLTYSISSNPANGTVTGTPPSVTYTPNSDFNGADSFTFIVNDGTVDSVASTVSISVTGTNDTPVSSAGNFSVLPDSNYNGTLSASDIDADMLSFSIVAVPSRGTVVIDNMYTGAFRFTPFAGEAGPDSFTFKVNDGTVDSNISTVTIDISVPGNTAPTAPQLVSPADGATGVNGGNVIFEWEPATDTDTDTLSYEITYCTNNSFTGCTPLTVGGWYQNSTVLIAGFGGGGVWLLFGLMGGLGRHRHVHRLLGIALITLTLSSCGGGGGGGATPVNPNLTHSAGLTAGTDYFWKVTVKDGRGGITESAVWSFTTAP